MKKKRKNISKKNSGNKLKRNLKWIIWLSVLGIIVSSYLLYDHYSTEPDPFCEAIGGGCDIVNRGPWSEIDGILMEQFNIFINFPLPVSVVGIIGFMLTIIISLLIINGKKIFFDATGLIKAMFWMNLAGWFFALYLTYIEFILLRTFCIYCDISKIIFTIVVALCAVNLKYTKPAVCKKY